MFIGPPIPEIKLFKKLTLKIQGQGHGWSRSSKSQCESNIMNILSTDNSLVPCQLTLPFLRYSIFKVWPWKSLVKVIAQGHKVLSRYNTPSTHIPFVPCQSSLPFLGYSYFKIWHWKFKVKVINEVKVESHNEGIQHSVDSHPFRSMSIGHPIPELWLFQNLNFENQGSRSWVRSQFKVTMSA